MCLSFLEYSVQRLQENSIFYFVKRFILYFQTFAVCFTIKTVYHIISYHIILYYITLSDDTTRGQHRVRFSVHHHPFYSTVLREA